MKQYLLSTSLIFNIVGTLHAGVVAHFPFDSNFSDTSGNGNHGVLVDQATLGDSGIISTASDYKFGGGAMDFSGADHLAIPSHTFSSGDPYTIAFWARLTAGDTGNSAVWDMVLGDISNNNHFVALGDSNNSNGLRWRGANSTTERQADFSFSTSYDWHHFALVASGTDLHLYRDGQLLRTNWGQANSKQKFFTSAFYSHKLGTGQ